MISKFSFGNGRVDFKQRRARTDKFVLEERAGRALFGAYRNPLTDDPTVKGRYRGTANTNVLIHGGQLLALKEDSPALAMDAITLETHGYTDFQGQVKSPTFTAHPKIDPTHRRHVRLRLRRERPADARHRLLRAQRAEQDSSARSGSRFPTTA